MADKEKFVANCFGAKHQDSETENAVELFEESESHLGSESTTEHAEDFRHQDRYVKNKPQDVLGLVLFVLNYAVFIALYVYSFYDYSYYPQVHSPKDVFIGTMKLFSLSLAMSIVLAFLFSIIVFVLIYRFPRYFTLLAFLAYLSVLVGLLVLFSVYSRKNLNYLALVITDLVVLVVSLIYSVLLKRYNRVTSVFLKIATRIMTENKSVFVFSFLVNFAQVVLDLIAFLDFYYIYDKTSTFNPYLRMLFLFLSISSYCWILATASYFQHTVISSISAEWLHNEGYSKKSVLSIFWETFVYKTGAIASGSMFIFLVQLVLETMKNVLLSMRRFLGRVAACYVRNFEFLLNTFNVYVLVEVAMNNESYFKSARKVRKLFLNEEKTGVLNFVMTSSLLFMATFFGAAITFFASFFIIESFYVCFWNALSFGFFVYPFLSILHSIITTVVLNYIKYPQKFETSTNEDMRELEYILRSIE